MCVGGVGRVYDRLWGPCNNRTIDPQGNFNGYNLQWKYGSGLKSVFLNYTRTTAYGENDEKVKTVCGDTMYTIYTQQRILLTR